MAAAPANWSQRRLDRPLFRVARTWNSASVNNGSATLVIVPLIQCNSSPKYKSVWSITISTVAIDFAESIQAILRRPAESRWIGSSRRGSIKADRIREGRITPK